MTQYTMKKGIKMFGDDGVDVALKEMKQLHDPKVLEPRSPSQLSERERHQALHYLMLLKKKRCGKNKGLGCADGRKQRAYLSKEDVSSPTVWIEAVLLSCVIDAQEGCNVATVDIPGAFMQAEPDEVLHMKLEGQMAELMVRLDPQVYCKHIQVEGGKMVLYVELKKSLYGTLQATFLFWRLLSGCLQEWGFEINLYDWCVANKTIEGFQCTILWHVDDLKISHQDPKVVDKVIELIAGEFGKEAPLTVNRGTSHEYLGINLCFDIPGKVCINMSKYIKAMMAELSGDMDGQACTPASLHLFEGNNVNPEYLSEEIATMFHHNVAKLLFLCKRARPDIQTAMAFLCTRVKKTDTDYYKKLARVMRYL
jgi:Reverse transcriptase (RNA-dependent DNA polymerase)